MRRRLGGTLIAIATFRAFLGAIVLIWLSHPLPDVEIVCLAALAVAQLTDHLDGWLARRYSTPCLAGYLQDSVSDKLFHVGCLIGLQTRFDGVGLLLWGLLAREFILLASRVLAPEVDRSLARLRTYSVAYAALVRLGILSFMLSLWGGAAGGYAISVGYALLAAAVILGTLGWAAALKPSRSSEARRRPAEEP
ncbi:MAG TPA: CDP-alcohol phosphatidyltransferase family protein [Allosphingosinicella sp.]|jgi:phosphatidylglycerophosphate synthase